MKLEAELKCPQCCRSFRQKLEEMRPGRSRRCPGCGTSMAFTGDSGREAQRALDRLERDLSRTLNVKIKF